ncbi:hypothetical protein HK405_005734, partial [Cladochytrium tenue]
IPPDCVLGLPIGSFPALRKLAFDCMAEPDSGGCNVGGASWDAALEHLAASLPQVEELLVGGYGVLSARGLRALSRCCGATMKSMVFHEVAADVGARELAAALVQFPRLERLCIGAPVSLSTASATSFSVGSGDVVGSASGTGAGGRITAALGVTIARWCPRLQHFDCGDAALSQAVMEVARAVRREFMASTVVAGDLAGGGKVP